MSRQPNERERDEAKRRTAIAIDPERHPKERMDAIMFIQAVREKYEIYPTFRVFRVSKLIVGMPYAIYYVLSMVKRKYGIERAVKDAMLIFPLVFPDVMALLIANPAFFPNGKKA